MASESTRVIKPTPQTTTVYDLSITLCELRTGSELPKESRKFNTNVSRLDDTKASYRKCKISGPAEKKTVWIVYEKEQFNGKYRVIYPGENDVFVEFNINSAQAFNCTNYCLALFPLSDFRGGLTLTDQGLDVVEKVFSGISRGGNWQVKDEFGTNTATFSDNEAKSFNDAGMSVKRL